MLQYIALRKDYGCVNLQGNRAFFTNHRLLSCVNHETSITHIKPKRSSTDRCPLSKRNTKYKVQFFQIAWRPFAQPIGTSHKQVTELSKNGSLSGFGQVNLNAPVILIVIQIDHQSEHRCASEVVGFNFSDSDSTLVQNF